ncbi:hypothetical protein A3K73_03535 [Candidatus Pacearchaeota archaeon RBG_13_36_9]|nr:MAG: hypothetical protein A3K73_03535 [Candidatus Pacearchaeota archaeon RBG_13_36_9]
MVCLEELSTCTNQECRKAYNPETRKKQTEEYSDKNSAHLYCSDLCWVVSTKGKEEATKEVLVTS